jgi:hypothetical protein
LLIELIGYVFINQIFTGSEPKSTSIAKCAPDLAGATLYYGPTVIPSDRRVSSGFGGPGMYGFRFKLGPALGSSANNPSKCVHFFAFFEEEEGFSGNTFSPPAMNS